VVFTDQFQQYIFRYFGIYLITRHFSTISYKLFCILSVLVCCFIFSSDSFQSALIFSRINFLIHPIQVESVAYIGATQSELLFLFGLSALMISFKEKLQWKSLVVMSLFLFLSILTNETGFLFLILILVYQLFYNRKHIFLLIPATIVPAIIYMIIRLDYAKVQVVKHNLNPIGLLPLHERIMTMPAIFFYYIRTFIYPSQLGIYQSWTVRSHSFQEFYLPLIMDCLFFLFVAGLGIYVYKKNRQHKVISIFLYMVLSWSCPGSSNYTIGYDRC